MGSKENMGILVTEPPPHLLSLSLLYRETFCQRAPSFLDYLHSILQKYPDGGQILKVRCPSPIRDLLPSRAALLQAVGLVPVQHQPRALVPSWERGLMLFSGPGGPR